MFIVGWNKLFFSFWVIRSWLLIWILYLLIVQITCSFCSISFIFLFLNFFISSLRPSFLFFFVICIIVWAYLHGSNNLSTLNIICTLKCSFFNQINVRGKFINISIDTYEANNWSLKQYLQFLTSTCLKIINSNFLLGEVLGVHDGTLCALTFLFSLYFMQVCIWILFYTFNNFYFSFIVLLVILLCWFCIKI